MNLKSILENLRFEKIRYFGVRTKADKLAIVKGIHWRLKTEPTLYPSPYTCCWAMILGGQGARDWLFEVWQIYMGRAVGNVFEEFQWDIIAPFGRAVKVYPQHRPVIAVRLYALDVLRNDIIGGKL